MALVIGNWKMNGIRAALDEARKVAERANYRASDSEQIVICPPATLLLTMSEMLKTANVLTGAQDCHPEAAGAHTGRLSAEMLADAGASYCIIGHSECRAECGDHDMTLGPKVDAVLRAGMVPVFCVGESLKTRDAGEAEAFVEKQLAVVADKADRVVVAYEPIWAIGTGRTPSNEDIAAMHAMMRDRLGPTTPLLYGGSVKPSNAKDILSIENVGGALVGGASLNADDFIAIARAAA
jgi:triosephosphate isomerase